MGEPASENLRNDRIENEAEPCSLRAGGFTQVPNAFIRGPLPPDVKIAAIVLLSYAWGDGGARPSQETLARDLSRSVDYVQRQLAHLASRGIVTTVRRGRKSNMYVLNRDAAELRLPAASMPQECGNAHAAKPRSRRGLETASLRHDKDSGFKTQNQQHARAGESAVVVELKKALREIGVSETRADQVALLGATDPDRARAWIAVAPALRGKKDNVPAYVCSGISNSWEPPVISRAARALSPAEQQLLSELQAAEERVAVQQRAEREAEERREVDFATLSAGDRADLERRAAEQLTAEAAPFLQHLEQSPARIRTRAARIAAEDADTCGQRGRAKELAQQAQREGL